MASLYSAGFISPLVEKRTKKTKIKKWNQTTETTAEDDVRSRDSRKGTTNKTIQSTTTRSGNSVGVKTRSLPMKPSE